MSRKTTSLLMVALASCGGAEGEAPTGTPRPVVLIVVDTLRKDHLGCYGYQRRATSPNLDRLAADSVRYDRAVSQAPWTTPSIGALLSSQYPSTLGIKKERSILPDDVTLLSEVLQEHGYRTGAVVSHSFCSSEWGFARGFDQFEEVKIDEAISSVDVTEQGLAFLDEHGDGNFFLWLHYFDPHFAYQDHDAFPFEPDPSYQGPVHPDMSIDEVKALEADIQPADLEEMIRLYDSEIAFTDHQIGRVLERLREMGVYQNALIVFVADHGEGFQDHGLLGHHSSLYTELTEVPLLIRFPGLAAGVVETAVGSVDVLPTLLSFLEMAPPEDIVGVTLPPLAEGAGHFVFLETDRGAMIRAVVADPWKLIRHMESGIYELYNLDEDPHEQHDLWPEQGAKAGVLVERLKVWTQELRRTGRAGTQAEITPQEAERLRQLGYTDG